MVIILMGVTGSGKTTIGRMLAEELGWKYYDADDFHSAANIAKMKSGNPLNDQDRQPWLRSLAELIRTSLAANENVVLACSALKESYRDHLRIDEEVKLVYLKGDHDLIQSRLSKRHGHYMDPTLLDSQFEILEEPDVTARVDISGSPNAIVQMIKQRLQL